MSCLYCSFILTVCCMKYCHLSLSVHVCLFLNLILLLNLSLSLSDWPWACGPNAQGRVWCLCLRVALPSPTEHRAPQTPGEAHSSRPGRRLQAQTCSSGTCCKSNFGCKLEIDLASKLGMNMMSKCRDTYFNFLFTELNKKNLLKQIGFSL